MIEFGFKKKYIYIYIIGLYDNTFGQVSTGRVGCIADPHTNDPNHCKWGWAGLDETHGKWGSVSVLRKSGS